MLVFETQQYHTFACTVSEGASIQAYLMQWGKWGIEDLIKSINPGTKHLLGMNEPGHQQQSNLSPTEAAALWPIMEQVASSMGLRLGTPSPAPCGAQCVRSNPFQWCVHSLIQQVTATCLVSSFGDV